MPRQTERWVRRIPNLFLGLLLSAACNDQLIGGMMEPKPWMILPIDAPIVSVVHSPADPTTNDTIRIFATVSDSTTIATLVIALNDSAVASCAGARCEYEAVLRAGPHTYGATATDTAGSVLTDGPHAFTVWLHPPQSGGFTSSPHWRHIRTSVLDYRIHYQREPERSREYDWAAARYDHVVGGLGLLNEYRKRNPTIRHSTYDKLWFTPAADAGAMENWLIANGYPVENAYLHAAGTSVDSANRITAQQFAGRDYWYLNLADPGFRAWRLHRTRQLTTANAQGQRSETLFLDTNANSTVRRYIPAATLEYPSHETYFADFYALLATLRAEVPAGYLVLNMAQYFTRDEEMVTARVAGGVMTEYGNTPYGRTRWLEVDQLVADGVVVHLATGVSPGSKNNQRADMTAGNYDSIRERVLMWEYGSYLMVVDPERMDAVLFETYGLNWSHPFSVTWLPAFEVDIGLATAKRRVLDSGVDAQGQRFNVFIREFENGLVLIRPQEGGSYGDATAVDVTVPNAPWRVLQPDGSLSGEVSSVTLRNSEALILMR